MLLVKVPVMAVPYPFGPTVSMKYSAAVTVELLVLALLHIADRVTEAAPFVGFGVTATALVKGPRAPLETDSVVETAAPHALEASLP